MSHFVSPQFCFGYSKRQYAHAVMMSVDDPFNRNFIMMNDQFNHLGLPVVMNTTTSNASPSQLNVYSPANNFARAVSSQKHQSFRKVDSNHEKPMSEKVNGYKLQINGSLNASNTGTRKCDFTTKKGNNAQKDQFVTHFQGINKGNSTPFSQGNSCVKSSNSGIQKRGFSTGNFHQQDKAFCGQNYPFVHQSRVNNKEKSFSSGVKNCKPFPHEKPAYNNGHLPHSTSNYIAIDSNTFRPCSYCRQNGDQQYKDHQLKDSSGNVVCPILWSYVCKICGATGSRAHSTTYCPVLKASGQKVPKSAVCLKNTLRDSSGCIRKQHLY